MVTLHIEIEQHFAGGLHGTCPQAYKDVLMKISGILREDECTCLSGGGRLLDGQANLYRPAGLRYLKGYADVSV